MRNSSFSFIMLYFQKKKFPEPVRIIMFFFRDKLKDKISTLDNQARKSWKQNFMIDGRQGVLSSQVTKLTKNKFTKETCHQFARKPLTERSVGVETSLLSSICNWRQVCFKDFVEPNNQKRATLLSRFWRVYFLLLFIP